MREATLPFSVGSDFLTVASRETALLHGCRSDAARYGGRENIRFAKMMMEKISKGHDVCFLVTAFVQSVSRSMRNGSMLHSLSSQLLCALHASQVSGSSASWGLDAGPASSPVQHPTIP